MPAQPPKPASEVFQPQQMAAAGIAFLAVCAAAVAACVAGVFSSENYRAFTEIENTYRGLIAAELFFVIFVWPLFSRRAGATGAPALAMLLVLSVPLVLIAVSVSNVSAAQVLRTQSLLFAVGAAAVAACKLMRRAGEQPGRFYYLAAAALAGALPLAQFVLLDVAGRGLQWLSCFSPFWAMELAMRSEPEVPRAYWPLSLCFFAAVTIGLEAAARRRK